MGAGGGLSGGGNPWAATAQGGAQDLFSFGLSQWGASRNAKRQYKYWKRSIKHLQGLGLTPQEIMGANPPSNMAGGSAQTVGNVSGLEAQQNMRFEAQQRQLDRELALALKKEDTNQQTLDRDLGWAKHIVDRGQVNQQMRIDLERHTQWMRMEGSPVWQMTMKLATMAPDNVLTLMLGLKVPELQAQTIVRQIEGTHKQPANKERMRKLTLQILALRDKNHVAYAALREIFGFNDANEDFDEKPIGIPKPKPGGWLDKGQRKYHNPAAGFGDSP